MEAKDTIIKLKAIPKQIFEGEMDNLKSKLAYLAGFKDGIEAQAGVSFKAGIREVVAWIQKGDITRPVRWRWNDPPPNRTIEIKLEAFLNKLKEWGLE